MLPCCIVKGAAHCMWGGMRFGQQAFAVCRLCCQWATMHAVRLRLLPRQCALCYSADVASWRLDLVHCTSALGAVLVADACSADGRGIEASRQMRASASQSCARASTPSATPGTSRATRPRSLTQPPLPWCGPATILPVHVWPVQAASDPSLDSLRLPSLLAAHSGAPACLIAPAAMCAASSPSPCQLAKSPP